MARDARHCEALGERQYAAGIRADARETLRLLEDGAKAIDARAVNLLIAWRRRVLRNHRLSDVDDVSERGRELVETLNDTIGRLGVSHADDIVYVAEDESAGKFSRQLLKSAVDAERIYEGGEGVTLASAPGHVDAFTVDVGCVGSTVNGRDVGESTRRVLEELRERRRAIAQTKGVGPIDVDH